jgi:Lysylphosphatidylglycerol synthase TM region
LQSYNKILEFFKQQPRYVTWLLKGGFVILFILLIWYQIFKREDIAIIKNAFLTELKGQHSAWFIFTLLLLPINWAVETLKWLHLIRHNESISFWQAYKAVLAGVTFSVFTPNRVGEFGGRILFLKSENTIKGIFSTVVGSWAQQVILISFGYIGFIYFMYVQWHTEKFILVGIFFLALLFIFLLFFVFLNLEIVVPIFKKIRILYRFPSLIRNINIIRIYTKEDLRRTMFWAFVRYIIYCLQYYFMLRFFGINVPILRGISCIATIYLVQTSVPLPPVFGLLARNEIALQVWGLSDANPISSSATTISLWIINLIIPAFIGLIFILKANLLKSLGYEKIS